MTSRWTNELLQAWEAGHERAALEALEWKARSEWTVPRGGGRLRAPNAPSWQTQTRFHFTFLESLEFPTGMCYFCNLNFQNKIF